MTKSANIQLQQKIKTENLSTVSEGFIRAEAINQNTTKSESIVAASFSD